MDLDQPLGMLLFLSIFEILGGAAFGAGLRGLIRREPITFFFLLWGGGFGGIPFLLGAAEFLASEQPGYFFAQLFIFLTAIVSVALLPADFLELKGKTASAEIGAIIGAVMTMMGGAFVLFNLKQALSFGFVVGGFFGLLGALILILSAVSIMRSLQN